MDTLEMIKTTDFWQENKPFFDAGVLRTVYAGEEFCVCNMCNSSYVTFDLVKLLPGESRHGLRTTINQVKAMVEDPGYYLRWLDHLKQNDGWQMRLVELDEPTLAWMKSLKAQTDLSGPSAKVDLKYENWLYKNKASKV